VIYMRRSQYFADSVYGAGDLGLDGVRFVSTITVAYRPGDNIPGIMHDQGQESCRARRRLWRNSVRMITPALSFAVAVESKFYRAHSRFVVACKTADGSKQLVYPPIIMRIVRVTHWT
jgi:hypothetical protein